MKRTILGWILLLICHINIDAQQISFGPLHSADSPREDWLLPGDTIYQDGQPLIYQGKPMKNVKYSITQHPGERESLDRQYNDNPISNLSYDLGGVYGYGLHQGLNLSLEASAFATFGKGLPHRGGFSQNINATYLTPLTKDGKLWVAAGGYFNNTFWGSDSYRDVGLYAIMGYKFNEHWEAYVYGQLSISNNYSQLYNRYLGYGRMGMGYYPGIWGSMAGTMPMGYGMGTPGANVLGAGVKYNVNKNFSIGFNFEGVWYNTNGIDYFDRYNYPNPNEREK